MQVPKESDGYRQGVDSLRAIQQKLNIMKTAKVISACIVALILFASPALQAQTGGEPSPLVKTSFSKKFASATDVKWAIQNSLWVVTFNNADEFSIVFLEKNGDVFAQGRKIQQLPLIVEESVETLRESSQAQYGNSSRRTIYEIVYASGGTKYYIPCISGDNSRMIVADNSGHADMEGKKHGRRSKASTSEVLAARD